LKVDKTGQTINSYNVHAVEYIEESLRRGVRAKDIEWIFSKVTRKNPKVVELGCGNGRDAKEILKYTHDYLGMDASEDLIKEARRYNPGVRFKVSKFNEFIFPKNVDIIIAFASLLHADMETFKAVLMNANRSLNDGGTFFISLQNGEYREVKREDNMGTRTFYLYTPENVESMLPGELVKEYADFQDLRGKRWFSLTLRKQSIYNPTNGKG